MSGQNTDKDLNDEQLEILKKEKHKYDYYQRAGTINSYELAEINEIHFQVYGQRMDLSCGSCVDSGLKTLYSMYEKWVS